jgi:transcriptional regulator with XRE-family HTH domain
LAGESKPGGTNLSIGTRIIQIRNQKNLTQEQISRRSGIATSYLSRVENRRLEPRPRTLRRIADALGVPVSDFFMEGAQVLQTSQCAITVSGNCIMESLRSGRGKAANAGVESYTPQQLQLLRMANYLIQSGDSRVLDALDLLLNALLRQSGRGEEGASESRASSRPARPPAGP